MSRFVRSSAYRHVYGQGSKKEASYDNLKVSASAWDTNLVSVNSQFLAVNYQVSGGGAFLVVPLSHTGKLPDVFPLVRAHAAPVLDTAWNPFDETVVASVGEDCKVQLTKIDAAKLESAYAEGADVDDFKPLPLSMSHSRKVGNAVWHPTAENVLATASYDIKLWDVTQGHAQVELATHPDFVQSMAFDSRGTLLATTCKDKKLRLFDVRSGPDAIKTVESHGGVKAARVCWLGQHDRIVTTGFSKLSDRQVFVWDTGNLDKPVKQLNVDASSAGTLMPFWSDNNILFLAGKGDGNIRYYEYEADELHYLTEYKSSQPQRGMTFLPRRALDVANHEIARAYKVTNNCIEPVPFYVPRKSETFQSDIYPPAPAAQPALTASEFFGGKTADANFISLEHGQSTPAPRPSAPSTPARSQTEPIKSTPATPSRQASEPKEPKTPLKTSFEPKTPVRQTSQSSSVPVSSTEPPATAPTYDAEPAAKSVASPSTPLKAAAVTAEPASTNGHSSETEPLRKEIEDLKSQVAERDNLIRRLELQVEKFRTERAKALELLSSKE